jgi:hypothetical protein
LVVIASSCMSHPKGNKKTDTVKRLQKDTVKAATTKKDELAIPDISGTYVSAPLEEGGNACDLWVKISKQNGQYSYRFSVLGTIKKGNVTIAKSDDPNQKGWLITFLNMPWASYEGDISDPDKADSTSTTLKLPTEITALLSDNELTFQNYGNSMNAYTVIQECDQKFIRLVKH